MYSLAVLLLIAVSVVAARTDQSHLLGCPIILGKSAAQLPSQVEVCPYTFGGFHVLCGYFNHTTASLACQQRGWRVAAVNDLNSLFAINTVQQCTINNVWVAAFNGLNQDPYMIMEPAGGIWVGLDNAAIGDNREQVLCQEVPVVVKTLSFDVTETVTVGTVTRSITVTRHPTRHPHCHNDRCNAPINAPQQPPSPPIQKDNLDADNHKERRPECRDCDVAVALPNMPHLRLIRESVPYEKAAAACARYGWSLADYTAGMIEPIIQGLAEVAPKERFWVLWMRSYEGVTGGRCIGLRLPKVVGHVIIGMTPRSCAFADPKPLCQCGPPLATGNGPYVGSTTTTTTSETRTITQTIPIISTETSTSCQRCEPMETDRPRRHGHRHRRPH